MRQRRTTTMESILNSTASAWPNGSTSATTAATTRTFTEFPRLLRLWSGAPGGTHGPAFLSTLRLDEPTDLLRGGEDRVGSVAHHPGAHQSRRSLLRTVLAAVGLDPKIAFPERVQLPVGGVHAIGIAAIADRFNSSLRIRIP